MTTYTFPATYLSTGDSLETYPTVITWTVDETATTFSYGITFENTGYLPLVEFSTADASGTDLGSFSVLIEGVTYASTDLNLFFGQTTWGPTGTENTSYLVDLMFASDTSYSIHYIFQIGGDPIGLGTDMTIEELLALKSILGGSSAISLGTFIPLTQIPFSALAYLINPDPDVNIINGTTADDVYYVGDGSDWVDGGAGNDEIYGEDGGDTVSGGDGNDKVSGGNGDDIVNGNAGNDLLHGNAGADVINGGTGDDRIFGGTGDDEIDGGIGNDRILGGSGNDVISGGEGDDTVLAGTGNDTLNGGDGNDLLRGQSGDDIINGDAGNDLILGGNGNDTLDGGAGNDTILGGRGNDILTGGLGDDVLNGGAGADSFVFLATDGGVDQITDFDVALDTLDLSGYLSAHTEAVMTMTDIGNGILIDFGNGDTIQLDNVASISDLDLSLIL